MLIILNLERRSILPITSSFGDVTGSDLYTSMRVIQLAFITNLLKVPLNIVWVYRRNVRVL